MNIQKIAFCTDFSENAELAFEAACDMAKKFDAKLHILHVLPPEINPLYDGGEEVSETITKSLIQEIEEKMQKDYDEKAGETIDCEFVVMNGHISTEILNYLEDNKMDVVVMGSYGLSGVGLVLFGSVAKRVAHKAPCSVMIIRKPA